MLGHPTGTKRNEPRSKRKRCSSVSACCVLHAVGAGALGFSTDFQELRCNQSRLHVFRTYASFHGSSRCRRLISRWGCFRACRWPSRAPSSRRHGSTPSGGTCLLLPRRSRNRAIARVLWVEAKRSLELQQEEVFEPCDDIQSGSRSVSFSYLRVLFVASVIAFCSSLERREAVSRFSSPTREECLGNVLARLPIPAR